MTQEERTKLITEIRKLLQMQEDTRNAASGKMFDEETIKYMKAVLLKLLTMSLI